MLVVRGVNVFPTEIEAVLLADERVGPHYLIVEDRRDPARAELRIVVEPLVESAVPTNVAGALRERLGISCVVTVAPIGTVPRVEVGKARRLVRWESGEAPVEGLV